MIKFFSPRFPEGPPNNLSNFFYHKYLLEDLWNFKVKLSFDYWSPITHKFSIHIQADLTAVRTNLIGLSRGHHQVIYSGTFSAIRSLIT